MATTIQAIETHYNGYRFRSRLEARWAVFFDAFGVKYLYEYEGYSLPPYEWSWGGERPADVSDEEEAKLRADAATELFYLPDFWLPERQFFVEVKGRMSSQDLDKAMRLGNHKARFVIIAQDFDEKAEVIIPRDRQRNLADMRWLSFGECPLCGSLGWVDGCPCDSCVSGPYHYFTCTTCMHDKGLANIKIKKAKSDPTKTPRMVRALDAARSARFEHGETPQVIERKVYIERDPQILSNADILVRYQQTPEELLEPTPHLLVHLDDRGRPLCAPLDPEKDGGFNLKAWRSMRADVSMRNVCPRCLKYSIARARRVPRGKVRKGNHAD